MSYIGKSLVTGERIVQEGRFHWTYKLAAVFWLLLGFAVFVSVLLVPDYEQVAVFSLLLAVPGLIMLIRVWTTEIAVTNRRLIYKRGWIARKTDEITLNRIEEVNLEQSVPGRLLGYGKVLCRGTGAGVIVLPTMDDPLRFKKALQEAQVAAEGR